MYKALFAICFAAFLGSQAWAIVTPLIGDDSPLDRASQIEKMEKELGM